MGVTTVGEFGDSKEEGLGFPYFHIDSKNNTCFSAKESKLASMRIKEMGLMSRVLEQLNEIPFVLPQHTTHETSEFFCNETVYGKLNLLMVTGVAKLV